jgi:hypothetical protein
MENVLIWKAMGRTPEQCRHRLRSNGDDVSPGCGSHMGHLFYRYAEENMRASHFNAGGFWSWLLVGAILATSCIGCKQQGSSERKKITVLDPRGQPSGKFGRRGKSWRHLHGNDWQRFEFCQSMLRRERG